MKGEVATLLRQHDETLASLDAIAERLAALAAPLRELVAYFEAEMEEHFAVEEERLFPQLAACADVAPDTIPLLVAEHGAARARLGELAEALAHGSVASQVAAAESLIDLFRAHVAKEDAMLLAVAVVTPDL
ncbi:MAG: hemerythrin domain-containing protein [Myxococcales bacterium]|jgi:hemerythrin-like domain-containing protein|nr:hemerythrin domain-containing protein [Myxococcales bacterium]